ncbi:MAG: hypothetical protein JNJ47_07360, partial [Alphaproteobacteria bacterium]|nr:hypothetical protein [Alphaproteobacteria bacterium]
LVFLPFSNGTSIGLKAHYSQDSIELDPQDPLRPHIVTKLSDSFFERIHPPLAHDYPTIEGLKSTSGGIGMQNYHDGEELVTMGEFIYNPKLMIGHGGEGCVYLAQHNPSKSYVALKIAPVTENTDSQYNALKKLGRLYACYSRRSQSETDRRNYYIFMPLVDGHHITFYHCISPESASEKLGINSSERIAENKIKLNYRDVDFNFRLVQSLIEELEFLGAKGVWYEIHHDNIMVNKSQKVVCIDLHDSEIKMPEKINFNRHCRYVQYFLGLTPFLVEGVPTRFEPNIIVPGAIKVFNDEIMKSFVANKLDGFYSLADFKKAFALLRTKMENLK